MAVKSTALINSQCEAMRQQRVERLFIDIAGGVGDDHLYMWRELVQHLAANPTRPSTIVGVHRHGDKFTPAVADRFDNGRPLRTNGRRKSAVFDISSGNHSTVSGEQ